MGPVRNAGNITQSRVRLHAAGDMMNKSFTNVYLIGPMGSGKTTIGQRLAKMLGLEFLDNDHELEKQTGASVNLIFDLEGEEGFRERETAMLKKLITRQNVLIATGGGTILKQENRDLLRQSGLVVYLRTSVRQQIKRLGRDKTRPLLQSVDREEKLIHLAKERNPLYQELADVTFPSQDCGQHTATRALHQAILEYWEHQDDPTRTRT